MTIPTSTTFPNAIDTDDNLFLVHDALRVRLVEDYHPGDTSIIVEGETTLFPPTGFITLTDQCNDLDHRALTFYYASRTRTTFDGLELLVGFKDAVKPKRLTNVTQNVMAQHHNHIKDALIAIEEFIGVKGTTDTRPLGETLEGRINFLRNLVLRPRAWFRANKRIGIVPLKVTFKDLSFRNPTSWKWDFGDNTVSTVSNYISVISAVPAGISNVQVFDLDGGTVEKTYYNPGIYSVKLTISNAFGVDEITIPDLINARIAAPDEAVIKYTPAAEQTYTAIDSATEPFLYDHLLPGTINARANTNIELEVFDTGEQAGDPIVSYEWKLGDDLNHFDSTTTTASFGVGGYYDIKLRVNTKFGSYRTTVLRDAINIIEKENLFLFLANDLVPSAATKNTSAYEFGLISETFKTKSRSSYPVTRNYNFLNPSLPDYTRQKREFLRNVGFTPRSTLPSGSLGPSLLYWAEGGAASTPLSTQKIGCVQYEAFTDVWNSLSFFEVSRPWNWVSFNTSSNVYFALGTVPGGYTTGSSPTNQSTVKLDLGGLSTTSTTFTSSNYKNGAQELMDNVDSTGASGDFSVYRSAWKDSNGYLLRNDGVGNFFRLKSFYRTEGIISEPVQFFNKLPDMPGSPKLEGQLVPLSVGVYFFTNDSEVAVYSPTTGSWSVSAPTSNSASFKSLQDSTVSGFDESTNTLMVTSDGDRRAYVSFDYSTNVFLKFSEVDLAFTSLPARPAGEQIAAGVF